MAWILALMVLSSNETMKNGTCTDGRIALGAVASTPIRVHKAEALLKGNKITAALLTKVGETAVGETSPRDSIRGSAWYKKELVRVLTGENLYSHSWLEI
jgi:CO/xanthine dehydrogenase FAD-binding subunit